MRTGQGLVGVAGLQRQDDRMLFTPDERRLLDALLDQAALAIERSRLVEQVSCVRGIGCDLAHEIPLDTYLRVRPGMDRRQKRI